MMAEADATPVAGGSQVLPAGVVARIEGYLRHHFSVPVVARLSGELQRGHVVRDPTRGSGVIAYRQGILFVAGMEYVVSEE